MRCITTASVLALALALGGCVTPAPEGPSIAAMPPQGKSLAAFQQDDATCRQYAAATTGIAPGAAAQQSQVNSAALGTVLGAGLGAALGAASGNPGIGAAIGAGSGALLGTAQGANAAAISGESAQQRYDVSYAQCMSSKGDIVPNMTAAAGYGYGYPPPAYGYAYPYAYPYPYYYPYPGYVRFGFGWRHWR
ncbi:MAG: glycine zipper family protein [Stellaceae bacterium]